MMVLAGPGSGKTLVITHRIKYLIEHHNIQPSKILVITYTKAAAAQMQRRFEQITGQSHLPVSFGTFHAVFFKILKYAYNYRSDNIIDEEKKYQYMREIIERMDLEYEDESEFITAILSEISKVKGDLLPLQYYYAKNCSDSIFRSIYQEYEEKLRRRDKIDFDDMLVMCYELLSNRRDILALWQNQYQYILIDEFQDINRVQYEVIKLLAAPDNHLFIVGDDDQSIYGFRGARPEIMLNFEKDYTGCRRIVLDTNYRSDAHIIQRAQKLIGYNQARFSKAIQAHKEAVYPVQCHWYRDRAEEGTALARQILSYIAQGYSYGDMAILCRTNIDSRVLVQYLMQYNIPFCLKDAMPNLYEHWIAKNIITYMEFAMGNRERRDFLQIMNKPNRYISREYLTEPQVDLDELEKYYEDKEWMAERIEKLKYDLHMLRNMTPYAGIQYIYQAVGYRSYLQEYARHRNIQAQDLYDIVEELKEAARPYGTYQEWFTHIREYSEELKQQSGHRERVDGVDILTLHGSKGLEYNIVFLADVNEGVMPYKKAILEEDIEEERRMFYVGMTRAKEHLHICSVQERYGKKAEMSRFVREMGFSIET